MDREQRRLILAVCVAGVSFLALGASFTYVMDDMFVDLQATSQQEDLMRQAPSLAALLVVFVAGSIGHRLGERRVLVACGLLSVAGFALVLVATSMTWATIGLLVADGAHSAMAVVGLGLVSSMISGKDARASAFSTCWPKTVRKSVSPLVRNRLKEKTTSSAVIGVPSANVTSGRRLKITHDRSAGYSIVVQSRQ